MTTKHIVSYSGGMGSFAEAKECVDRYGKENVTLLFADTLMEDIDLYRFLNETVEFLGCELEVLSHGKDVWGVFEDTKFVGNSRVDICSRVLKRDIINNYITTKYGVKERVYITKDDGSPVLTKTGRKQYRSSFLPKEDVEIHLGIDATEGHRLTAVQERMAPWKYVSTLVEDGIFVYKNFSEQFGIKKPRLYDLGFSHNNCGGFCVKAGLGHFKILYEMLPDRYKEHEEKEERLRRIYGTKPFLKKTKKGETEYLYLKDYREKYLEKGDAGQFEFDYGGCGCALPS